MKKTKSTFLALLAVLLSPMAANADIIGFDFDWTGSSGYTMTGMFTFDDSDAGDGAIRDGEVVSLTFVSFLNGVSFGINNIAHTQAGFNFNFNTVAGQFFLNGSSSGDNGQWWNFSATGFGYVAGSSASALSFNANTLGSVSNPNSLTASRTIAVPEPGTLALFGLGLFGMGLSRRRKKV